MATAGRSIPVSKDLMHQAKIKYPGYTDQQALTMLMIDEFTKQHETDDNQSKLINAQRSENEKLKGAVRSIGQELDQLEQESVANDNEIERLKQLTARLRPASELTQQATQVSAKEIERVEKELELLKNKPGIDDKKYNELSSKIQELVKMPGVSEQQIKELEDIVHNLQKQNVVSTKMYDDAKKELDAKEERFARYIQKKQGQFSGQAQQHAGEIKKYADIVDKYKDEIVNFKSFMDIEKQKMQDTVNNLQAKADEYLDFMDIRGKEAQQATQSAIGNAQASSQQVVKKPQAPKPSLASLSSELDKEIEKERHLQNVSQNMKNPISPSELKQLSEDVKVSRPSGDPEYDEWIYNNLPILVKLFKNKFRDQLELKQPTYGDSQIAYEIEDMAPWLYNQSDEVLTKEHLTKFLNAVKVALFRTPVEPEQYDLDLKEGLDKTYERMLDNLIGFKNL